MCIDTNIYGIYRFHFCFLVWIITQRLVSFWRQAAWWGEAGNDGTTYLACCWRLNISSPNQFNPQPWPKIRNPVLLLSITKTSESDIWGENVQRTRAAKMCTLIIFKKKSWVENMHGWNCKLQNLSENAFPVFAWHKINASHPFNCLKTYAKKWIHCRKFR